MILSFAVFAGVPATSANAEEESLTQPIEQHTPENSEELDSIAGTPEQGEIPTDSPIIATAEEQTTAPLVPFDTGNSTPLRERLSAIAPAAATTGKWGTIDWSFESTVLTLGPGVAEGNTPDWSEHKNLITGVVFSDPAQTVLPEDSSGLFKDMANLEYISGSEDIDVSNVTNMSYMFANNPRLSELDVSGWDTSSVENMSFMFRNVRGVTELDVSQWDTSNVTNMSYLFSYLSRVAVLDVSKWNTSSVNDMSGLFTGASQVAVLDVSKWNTSSVNDMSYLFSGASRVAVLDVSKWDTSSVNDMSYLFDVVNRVTELDVSKWDTSQVTNMQGMFYGTSALTELDVSAWKTLRVKNMSYMFRLTESLTELDVSKWDTSSVTNMSNMFSLALGLAELDVSDWDTSSVTNMSTMFTEMYALTELDVSKWDTSSVTNLEFMFANVTVLPELDVSKWDTSKVTLMTTMFAGMLSVVELDVSRWNTSSVTSMPNMFESSTALTRLDLSGWDTSSVTRMEDFFMNTPALTQLTLGPETRLASNTGLVDVSTPPFNGKWVEYPAAAAATPWVGSSAELIALQHIHPTTYMRQQNISVTYHANNNTDEVIEIVTPSYVGIPVHENSFSHSGYEFVGWSASADGSGEMFEPATTLLPVNGTSYNFYAVWAKPVSPVTSTLVATPTEVVADGESFSTIRVTAYDVDGELAGRGGAAVTLEADLGTLSEVTDHGDGTYTATLTSTVVGTAVITGSINSSPLPQDAIVTFTAMKETGNGGSNGTTGSSEGPGGLAVTGSSLHWGSTVGVASLIALAGAGALLMRRRTN